MTRDGREGALDASVIVGIAIGVLVLLGLVLLVAARRRGADRVSDPDPMFVTGIALGGAGAALFATIGVAGAAMLAVGIVLMAVGIMRSPDRPPRGGSS